MQLNQQSILKTRNRIAGISPQIIESLAIQLVLSSHCEDLGMHLE